jgi:hypothetical protein
MKSILTPSLIAKTFMTDRSAGFSLPFRLNPAFSRYAWILAAALLLAGCGNNANSVNIANPTGVYTLVSVNGSNVPTTISHEGAKLEVRSGSFTFNANGTCSSKMVFVPPTGTEATRVVNATYTRDGSNLRMKWERAGLTTGSLQGDIFTMNNEGMVLAYRK